MAEWEILFTDEVGEFLDDLYDNDRATHRLVNEAIMALELNGPALARPLVDTIAGSRIPNLKELRPASGGQSEIRILFAFDPWRCAILLIAVDKSGRWRQWYRDAIPRAEHRYGIYLEARRKEMSQ